MNAAQPPPNPSAPNRPSALWAALRPYQWVKNLVIFAAPVFSQQIHLPGQALRSVAAFAAFCALSSAGYLFNDLRDRDEDRAHPVKCRRPLASGAVTPGLARTASLALLSGGLLGAAALGQAFFQAALLYVILQLAYSLALKEAVVLDVLAISVGFVLRALAGAFAVGVAFTNWLVVCSLFLALFLALGKRRGELVRMDQGHGNRRMVLTHYTPELLDALLIISASSALLTFTIYTCSPETVARLGADKLYLTLPFVVYGLFRYFWLVHEGRSEDPSRALLRDLPLAATVLAWGVVSLALLYSGSAAAP